jgi:AcrR family transcriptional regulator
MAKPYHHGDLKNALIQAGAELLAREGTAGLTLRKAARRAGVSHSAPYAHFADKQALLAAISTDALGLVLERIAAVSRRHRGDPLRQLQEAAWETVRFGLEQPDRYRVAFSNALEHQAEYPAYVEAAHRGFEDLVQLVRSGQAAGVVPPGPAEIAAVRLWSQVHGLVSLLHSRQIPGRVLARTSPRRLLVRILRAQLSAGRRRPARSRAPLR